MEVNGGATGGLCFETERHSVRILSNKQGLTVLQVKKGRKLNATVNVLGFKYM